MTLARTISQLKIENGKLKIDDDEEACDWAGGEGGSSRAHSVPHGTDNHELYGRGTVLEWTVTNKRGGLAVCSCQPSLLDGFGFISREFHLVIYSMPKNLRISGESLLL